MAMVNILSRIVCVSGTDVTSLPQRALWERGYNVYRNAYAGNESVDIGQLYRAP